MEPSLSLKLTARPDPQKRWEDVRFRMPDGWHKAFHDGMWCQLNCPSLGVTDGNLGVHLAAEQEVAQEVASSGDSPPPFPWFAYDPQIVSALVELADVTAMPEIIRRCPDQSDAVALQTAWDEEFAKTVESCSMDVSKTDLMQLWSGCLAAAKAISPTNYWIGPITPWMRFNLFKYSVFPECRRSPLYLAGALSARHFKAWRKEPFTMAGIPFRTSGILEFMSWA